MSVKVQRLSITPSSNVFFVPDQDVDVGAVFLVKEEDLVGLSAESHAYAHPGTGHGWHHDQPTFVAASLGACVALFRGGGVGNPALGKAAASTVEVGVVEFADRAVKVLVVNHARAGVGGSGYAKGGR